MKKRVLIICAIIAASFIGVYCIYHIQRAGIWDRFIKAAKDNQTLSILHEGGITTLMTDEQIDKLPEVLDKTVPAASIKKDRDAYRKIADSLIENLSKQKAKPQRKIENDETVKLGLQLDEKNFLYIYENSTALLSKDGKYYAYKIEDVNLLLEAYKEEFAKYKQDYVDPYYQLG